MRALRAGQRLGGAARETKRCHHKRPGKHEQQPSGIAGEFFCAVVVGQNPPGQQPESGSAADANHCRAREELTAFLSRIILRVNLRDQRNDRRCQSHRHNYPRDIEPTVFHCCEQHVTTCRSQRQSCGRLRGGPAQFGYA